MNDEAFVKKGYQISTDKASLQKDVVYQYLSQDSYWAKGMPYEKMERSIENSMCFGVYHDGKQIGFARVTTDNATFGYLADVFVLPAHRGIGLSKWLVQTIMQHEDLQGLRRWSLATADAHGLYAQFGFVPISKPEVWMEIHTPYQAPKPQENEHQKTDI